MALDIEISVDENSIFKKDWYYKSLMHILKPVVLCPRLGLYQE